MITKIFNTTTVADGSTERLVVHTKIGEFEVPGKRITCHVRPRDNDEYDVEFGKALAKKKFDILSTDDRSAHDHGKESSCNCQESDGYC